MVGSSANILTMNKINEGGGLHPDCLVAMTKYHKSRATAAGSVHDLDDAALLDLHKNSDENFSLTQYRQDQEKKFAELAREGCTIPLLEPCLFVCGVICCVVGIFGLYWNMCVMERLRRREKGDASSELSLTGGEDDRDAEKNDFHISLVPDIDVVSSSSSEGEQSPTTFQKNRGAETASGGADERGVPLLRSRPLPQTLELVSMSNPRLRSSIGPQQVVSVSEDVFNDSPDIAGAAANDVVSSSSGGSSSSALHNDTVETELADRQSALSAVALRQDSPAPLSPSSSAPVVEGRPLLRRGASITIASAGFSGCADTMTRSQNLADDDGTHNPSFNDDLGSDAEQFDRDCLSHSQEAQEDREADFFNGVIRTANHGLREGEHRASVVESEINERAAGGAGGVGRVYSPVQYVAQFRVNESAANLLDMPLRDTVLYNRFRGMTLLARHSAAGWGRWLCRLMSSSCIILSA